MTAVDIAVAAIGVVAFGAPLVMIGWGVKRFLRQRERRLDALTCRGAVGTFHVPLMLGIIIGGLGLFLLGVTVIPLLIWLFDSDLEARRVFFSMVGISAGFVLLGFITSYPGLGYWIAEPKRLVFLRLGRERSIDYHDVVDMRELRTLLGTVAVRSSLHTIKIPQQLSGYDEFLSVLRAEAPTATVTSWRTPRTVDTESAEVPLSEGATFSVPARRTRFTIAGLAALLALFWIGPWLVVNGEHPTRDALAFMGIGTFIWALFALLLAAETFQRKQPAHIVLERNTLRYRPFRKPWEVRRDDELLSASVETRIRYVKGMPGYLYPLVVTFTDGHRIEVDQMRAKHMLTTTHQLADELRRRYFDATLRTHVQHEASERHLQAASTSTGHDAIDHYRKAIAAYPDARRLDCYRLLGDILRRGDQHEDAVSMYRAHLDFAPSDHAAWEGLGAALGALGRMDTAAEATAQAERLLLHC